MSLKWKIDTLEYAYVTEFKWRKIQLCLILQKFIKHAKRKYEWKMQLSCSILLRTK